MSYNPEYYQKNKDKMRASYKKYYDRIRAEKIARGEILTPEQKAARKEQRKQQLSINARLRYQNDPVHKERCKAAFRERYHSDANFRKSKAEYLKEWRQSKKSEILT